MATTYEAIIALVGQMDPSLKKVTDQAKKELEALEKKAGKSNKNMNSMSSVASKTFKALGNFGKKALKTIAVGTAAAATGVGVLAKQSLDAYAEYEQLVGGVDTLFKGSSKVVQDYANNAYKTAGLSANNYMQTVTQFSASLLQSLGNDTQRAAEMADMAVIDMADNANKMGTPIEEIQRTYQSLARGQAGMLDNLRLGYGGTKNELKRLVKDANEYRKSIGETADLSVDKFSDVVQAIHDIQQQMDITGTTAKEASSTIQGSVNSMHAAWQNWLTGLANEDADLGGLTDQLLDSVVTVGKNVMPRLQTILSRLGSFIQSRAPQLVADLANGAMSAVSTLVPVGAQVLMSLAQGLVAASPQLFSMGFQLLAYLAQGIISSIPTVITIGVTLISQFAQACASYLPTLIPLGVEAILMLVNGLLQNLPAIIASAGQIIVALAQGIANAIPLLIQYGPEIITNLATGIISGLGQLVQCGWEILGALAQGIMDAIGSIGGSIWDALVRMFTGQPLEVPAEVGDVDTSAVSGADIPTIDTSAQVTEFDTSQIEGTELPTLEMPPVEIPEVDTSSLDALSDIQMPTIDTSGISGATADYSGIVSGAQSARQQVVSAFSGIGGEISAQMSGITVDYSGVTGGATSAAASVTSEFSGVGSGISAAVQSGLSGATSSFSNFTSAGTSSANQVRSSHQSAATAVMSIWSMALAMVQSRALMTISAFVQMGAAGVSAASSISGSMSGVAGNISSITSAAYAAVSALNAMASAARSAQSAAAAASAAKAVGFATGGFTSGPSIAGEDPRYPTEAVISFNPAYRAQNKGYLMQAARMLGMTESVRSLDKDPWTIGGELANSSAPITSNYENTVNLNVGGITFAPQIEIKGNASRDDIVAALRRVEPEFAELVQDVLAESEVGNYALDLN